MDKGRSWHEEAPALRNNNIGPFDGLDHTKGLRVPPGDLVQIVVVSGHGIGVYRGAGGGATVPRRATAVRRGGAEGAEELSDDRLGVDSLLLVVERHHEELRRRVLVPERLERGDEAAPLPEGVALGEPVSA